MSTKVTLRPSSGHVIDIDPQELNNAFLSRAINVNTRKGFPSRIGGRRIAYSGTGGAAFHLMNFSLNDFNWWLFLRAGSIFARQAGTTSDVTPVGLIAVANPYEWTSTLLNGIPVFNNGKNAPYSWDGVAANDAVPIPGFPAGTTCKAIAAFKFHLFAMDISNPSGDFDNLILWSDAAEPGTLPTTWTPLAGNEAGSTPIAEPKGRAVCGVPLGTQLIVYKESSMHAIEYQGQQPDNIFSVRPLVRSVGALSTNCVLEMGMHLVVGNDDVVLTDGINVRSIAENRIKTFLANSMDETNRLNAFVLRDINAHEVWVCVPEAGNQFCTVAHVWDERRDTWVTRDLNQVTHGITGFVGDNIVNNTWDADAQVWDADASEWTVSTIATRSRVVVSEPLEAYVEDTSDLNSVTSRLQRYDMTFDDDTQIKVTSRVWVYGTGTGIDQLQVRLGARNDLDENTPISFGAFKTIAKEGVPYEVTGRYISVETQHTGTDLYTVSKIIIEADYSGPY